jgi:predicted Rossmann fold nucleotide-binding protein DprA/Smf involved in DNA uptake
MGVASYQRLIETFGSCQEVLTQSQQALVLQAGIRQDLAETLYAQRDAVDKSLETWRLLQELEIHILYPDSAPLPKRLQQSGDRCGQRLGASPHNWHFLTVYGHPTVFDHPLVIGMVGRRQATPEGVSYAIDLARELAGQGVLILSGLAQGIDQAAHYGCLEGEGTTVGIVPEGILQMLQEIRFHRSLRQALETERLTIVSGAPPQEPWSVAEAMRRNTWIAQWSDALIVVEAGDKGGTWKTAQSAVKNHRPLFVAQNFVDPTTGLGNEILRSKLKAESIDTQAPLRETVDRILNTIKITPRRIEIGVV